MGWNGSVYTLLDPRPRHQPGIARRPRHKHARCIKEAPPLRHGSQQLFPRRDLRRVPALRGAEDLVADGEFVVRA